MQRFVRGLGALIVTALVATGVTVGATPATATDPAAPVASPADRGLLDLPLPLPDQFPQLTGVPAVGELLTVTQPVWNVLPGVLSTDITWLCDDSPIPGTQGVWTYMPTEAQAGCLITAQVVTTALGFLPLRMVTDALRVPGLGETAVTSDGAPTIKADKGTPKTGTTLSVSVTPSWKPDGVTTTYQWLRNGQPIAGREGTSYLLTKDDVDQSVSVRATGRKDGFTDGVVTSNAITGQLGDAPTPTRQPVLTGTPAVGRTLTVDPGTWGTGETPTFTYQWRRDTADLDGETGRTHTVTASDVGHTLTVIVTATRAGYRPGTFRTAGETVPAAKARSVLTATLSKKTVRQGRLATLRLVLTAVGVSAPSGRVKVLDGARVIKRLSLTAGKATVRLTKLKPGVHRLKAVYAGSDTVLGATSKVVRLTVKKR